MSEYVIEIKDIHKSYPLKRRVIPVLKGIDLKLKAGEFLSVMGPSGSGKSTLLNIIGTLDREYSGEYLFNGKSLRYATDNQLAKLRSESIGFVFQTFNLVQGLTILENVRLPFLYSPEKKETAVERSLRAIEMVGLSNRLDHRPSELSGGEMQRVAIARAIAMKPELVLADEPTGNLDSGMGMEILDLLTALNREKISIIMITHDKDVASLANRHIHIKDGRIIQPYE